MICRESVIKLKQAFPELVDEIVNLPIIDQFLHGAFTSQTGITVVVLMQRNALGVQELIFSQIYLAGEMT